MRTVLKALAAIATALFIILSQYEIRQGFAVGGEWILAIGLAVAVWQVIPEKRIIKSIPNVKGYMSDNLFFSKMCWQVKMNSLIAKHKQKRKAESDGKERKGL